MPVTAAAMAGVCTFVGFMGAAAAGQQRLEDRQNAALYDKTLLATIDSVAEMGVPMEKAIEKGFLLQNYHTSQDPVMNTDSLKIHKDIRLAEAREIDGIERDASGSYDTVFVYKPAFRDELAQKVAAAEKGNCRATCQGRGSDGGSFINSTVGRTMMFSLTRGF